MYSPVARFGCLGAISFYLAVYTILFLEQGRGFIVYTLGCLMLLGFIWGLVNPFWNKKATEHAEQVRRNQQQLSQHYTGVVAPPQQVIPIPSQQIPPQALPTPSQPPMQPPPQTPHLTSSRPLTTVPLANTTPTAMSSDNQFTALHGRGVILLRDNKLVIAAELVLIVTLLCLLPVLKFVSLFAPFLLIMALLWLGGNTWSKLGLVRPLSWQRTILLGLSFGIFFWLLRAIVIGPLVEGLVHARSNLNVFSDVHGHLLYMLATLIGSWTEAAFGEEMIFRGYLLNRFADLFGDNFVGWALALCLQAAIFGVEHTYQGPAGMIGVGIDGLLFGLLYLAARRNLWMCVLAHGVIDTISFILLFLY